MNGVGDSCEMVELHRSPEMPSSTIEDCTHPHRSKEVRDGLKGLFFCIK